MLYTDLEKAKASLEQLASAHKRRNSSELLWYIVQANMLPAFKHLGDEQLAFANDTYVKGQFTVMHEVKDGEGKVTGSQEVVEIPEGFIKATVDLRDK